MIRISDESERAKVKEERRKQRASDGEAKDKAHLFLPTSLLGVVLLSALTCALNVFLTLSSVTRPPMKVR